MKTWTRHIRAASVLLAVGGVTYLGSACSVAQEIKARLTIRGATDPLTITRDGKVLATASAVSFDLKLWDAATGHEKATLKGHTLPVTSLAFSPDGKILASGSFDEKVQLWDVTTGKKLATIKGPSSGVRFVAFTAEGRTLASAGDVRGLRAPFGEFKLWDVRTARELAAIKREGLITSWAVTADGKTVALGVFGGRFGGSVQLLDTSSGKETASFWVGPDLSTDAVSALAFTPDGKTLASGCDCVSDNTSIRLGAIKLWDVATGRVGAVFKGLNAEVGSLAFTRDGKILASSIGNQDGTGVSEVKVWDVRTGKELATLPQARGHVAFTADGRVLATSGAERKSVQLWTVPQR
jgi:WD40 repeat protein